MMVKRVSFRYRSRTHLYYLADISPSLLIRIYQSISCGSMVMCVMEHIHFIPLFKSDYVCYLFIYLLYNISTAKNLFTGSLATGNSENIFAEFPFDNL